jgi:hypothetical protein
MSLSLVARSWRAAAVLVCISVGSLAASAAPQTNCSSTYTATWFPATWPADGAALGWALALDDSGDRLVIGAHAAPHNGYLSGAVYAVRGFGLPSEREDVLLPSNAAPNRLFGYSVALSASGDVLVAGAPGANVGLGRAYVFRFDGNDWVEEQMLTSPYYDRLGYSADISDDGNVIALGAPERSIWPSWKPGAVDVHRFNGSSWVLEASLIPTSTLTDPSAGYAVSLSGDGRYLATGAFLTVNWLTRAVILIYENIGGAWMRRATLVDPAGQTGLLFGAALDLDARGETLAVGNRQDGRLVSSQGAVTIFRRAGSTWTYDSVLLPSSPTNGGAFGSSVALNAAGDRIVVGAPWQLIGAHRGVVEEFELFPGGANPIAAHQAPLSTDHGQFGRCVATNASGARWITSKPLADTYGTDFGEVHVFDANCLTPQVYCTAQPNTLGCIPSIAAQGTPSVSSPAGFVISASRVRNRQNGMLFYGTNGRVSLPWHSGTLCVAPPLRRTPVINSLGSPVPANDCSGVLSRDFNAWAFSASEPSLFAGQHVRAQFYSRDPGAPGDINVSDALEFYLEP